MKSTHFSALLVLAVATTTAYAQPKTDGLWRGTGGAGLSITSGNTDTQAVNLAVDMSSATATDRSPWVAASTTARARSPACPPPRPTSGPAPASTTTTSTPRCLSSASWAWKVTNLKGVDLALRTSLAGGVGYKLIETKALSFTLFGGAGYSTDKYDVSKTIDGKTAKSFNRASLFLAEESQHVLSPTTSFKQRLELYPGLSGDKAQIMKFTAGLGVAMSSTMSLNVGLTNNYNSKAANGAKEKRHGPDHRHQHQAGRQLTAGARRAPSKPRTADRPQPHARSALLCAAGMRSSTVGFLCNSRWAHGLCARAPRIQHQGTP